MKQALSCFVLFLEVFVIKDFSILPDERLDYVNEKVTLIQKKKGLTFGTDAFLLAAFIKTDKRAVAAELGCGTGIISLLCAAREKFSKIHAFEIQESFYDITARNIENNGFGETVSAHNADIRDIRPSDTNGEVDVVFSNPPYMKTDSGKRNMADEKYIARHEVKGSIYDFCAAAGRLLKFGGKFYVVWRPDRLSELFYAMKENSLEAKAMTFVHARATSEPSMVLISATKGGKPSMRITPPLILHSDDSIELSPTAAKIYETMNFDYDI